MKKKSRRKKSKEPREHASISNPDYHHGKPKRRMRKTTSSVSLAAAFALAGYSVTLVDADPQCNATDSFGIDKDSLIDEGRYTLADAYLTKKAAREIEYVFPNERFEARLQLIPGNRGLNAVSPPP